MSIESILAVSPDLTQAGLAVGMVLLIFDRVFTAVKPLLSRNGRNGHGETGKVLATLVEKVDAQGRGIATLVDKVDRQGKGMATLVEKVDRQGLDAKELKRQLETQWGKYDAMNQAVTKNTVGLDMWKRDCPARSGQLKVAQPEG